MKEVIYKVPNGKLIRLRAWFRQDGSFRDVQILGDFFVYPEDALQKIEQLIVGVKNLGEAQEHITSFMLDNEVMLVGITPEAIVHVLSLAQKDGAIQ